MKLIWKKVCAFLLVACMICAIVPAFSLSAFAETPEDIADDYEAVPEDAVLMDAEEVAPEALSASLVTRSPATLIYNGQEQYPTITVLNEAGDTLEEDVDYTVFYPEASLEVGVYSVIVRGIGNYTGSVRKSYIIDAPEALNSANVTRSVSSFRYTGEEQYPTVTVTNADGDLLTEDVDYKVSYSARSVEPGTYFVNVIGKGLYTGVVRKAYFINDPEKLDASLVTREPVSFQYNGEAQHPTVTVKNEAGEILTEGVDYTVSYSGKSIEPGTYYVNVTGMGVYRGIVRKAFTIKPSDDVLVPPTETDAEEEPPVPVEYNVTEDLVEALDGSRVTRVPTTLQYNGEAQYPTVTVTNSLGETLRPDVDYTLSYSGDSINPGFYFVIVTGMGNYSGSVRKGYYIKEALDVSRVTRGAVYYSYTGQEQYPTITVTNGAGETLTEDVDYTVTYPEKSVKPGYYFVTVLGKGYYTGSVRKIYVINDPETLKGSGVIREPISFQYTGETQYPTVTVKNAAGETLTEGVDYTVSYPSRSAKPGTYFVTVTGKGIYRGSVRKAYYVKDPETLDSSRVTRIPTSFQYNGEAQYPTPVVKNAAGETLTEGVDYIVSYSDKSVDPGTYFITVTGTGIYKGSVRKAYTIK